MNRTIFLAAIAVAALLLQLFPDHAGAIKIALLVIGALYFLVRALRVYPQRFRARRRQAAQLAADEVEYARYAAELAALRATFDPRDEFAGRTDVPQAYRDALSTLHAKYQVMLERKFGAH